MIRKPFMRRASFAALQLSVALKGGSMIRLLLQGDAGKLSPFGYKPVRSKNSAAGYVALLQGLADHTSRVPQAQDWGLGVGA